MKTKLKKSETCLSCPEHKVINDRDPDDWFCDDDSAVVCRKTPNPNRNTDSEWVSNWSKYRIVACSCRPYNLQKESKIPEWCPKKKKVKKKVKVKKLIALIGIMIFVLTGCGETCKIKTPPWNKEQIEQMKVNKIETVPFVIVRF